MKSNQTAEKVIVSKINGTIIESKTDAHVEIKELENQSRELTKERKRIKEEFGLDKPEFKTTNGFFWKIQKDFQYKKDCKINWWTVISDLTPVYKSLLMFFIFHTDHRDNSIVVNGKSPLNKEIAELANVSDRAVTDGIRKLKKLNILTTQHKGRYRKIYMNPYFINDSKTEETIYDMF